MKNLLTLIALVLFTMNFATAQEAEKAVKAVEKTSELVEKAGDVSAPIMTFETMNVEYGEIAKGSDPLRIVKFSNTGNAPLIIKHAKGSCGCTVPLWPKEPIMPGEESKIEIRYDTKRVGPIRKTVRITTNEPGGAPHVLQVKGKINADAPAESLPAKKDLLTGQDK